MSMKQHLNLNLYPIDRLDSVPYDELIRRCQRDIRLFGMFSLTGFVRLSSIEQCVAELKPLIQSDAFTHCREHNIYFDDDFKSVESDHPALRRFKTINHTICGDQIPFNLITRIYEWQPLIDFLAAVMGKPQLHPMADPLARINVMTYYAGEALNWHFDRSEFTTTLLLQSPRSGGLFKYRSGLRSSNDPNYEGVSHLLGGKDDRVATLPLEPGTLNIFKGRNTAHRTTPVKGARPRIIAVLSYYENANVSFSDAERIGFFGRSK